MKPVATKLRPTIRRTLRVLGGRRIMIEGFGRQTFLMIVGGSEGSVGAWLSPSALRKLVTVAKRILK